MKVKLVIDGKQLNLEIDEQQPVQQGELSALACANERADTLMRQLRRFSVDNRKNAIDINNCFQNKYAIAYDHEEESLFVYGFNCTHLCGVVCFDSSDVAKKAMDAYCNELIWYFTEYKDCL